MIDTKGDFMRPSDHRTGGSTCDMCKDARTTKSRLKCVRYKDLYLCATVLLFMGLFNLKATSQWVPNGIPVCDTTAEPLFYMLPQIASDGRGGAFVCWQDYRMADIFVQHVAGDGSMLWQKNGSPLINDSAAQQYPRIINDGSDGAYVAWEDDRSGKYTHVYAQHLGPEGHSLWTVGGPKFLIEMDSSSASVALPMSAKLN